MRKINKIYVVIPIVAFAFGLCSSWIYLSKIRKHTQSDFIYVSDNPDPIDYTVGLEKKIIEDGSIGSYTSLSIFYYDTCADHINNGEFLLYALFMANKYELPRSFGDTYEYMFDVTKEYNKNVNNDMVTKNMAMKYLKHGVELMDEGSISIWNNLK